MSDRSKTGHELGGKERCFPETPKNHINQATANNSSTHRHIIALTLSNKLLAYSIAALERLASE